MRLVHNTDPYNTQRFVPIDDKIIVLFKEDIAEHTLRDNIQIIAMNSESFHEFDYIYSKRRLEITVKNGLKGGEQYKVTIRGGTDGVQTIIGGYSPADYNFEFYTRESTIINKPIIISPINETKYARMPKIILKTEMHDELDHYVVQISRNKSFNKMLWGQKVRNIYSERVEVIPKFKDPKERIYIRALGVDSKNQEMVSSDIIQIYIKEEELILPSPPEEKPPEKDKDSEEKETSLQTYPENMAVDVPANENSFIYILFDEEVDPESVTKGTVYIRKEEN